MLWNVLLRTAPWLGLLLVAGPSTPVEAAFDDDEVRAIILNQIDPNDYPDAGGVWMAKHRIVELDGSGNFKVTEHRLCRVLDPEWAREYFGPYRVSYWSDNQSVRLLRARIWSAYDSFEAVDPAGVTHEVAPVVADHPSFHPLRELRIEFPEVQPGDVLEILYEFQDRVRRDEYNARYFQHVFGDDLPVVEEQLVFRRPAALQVLTEQIGPVIMSQEIRQGSFRSDRFITGHLAALDPPPVVGSVSRVPGTEAGLDDSTSAFLMSSATWKFMSRYCGRQWGLSLAEPSPEMEREARRLTAGITDPAQKLRRILDYVQKEVETLPIHHAMTGIRPVLPGVVFEAGAGAPKDKTCLLVAMLQTVGIAATPVLVRTDGGAWAPENPCLDQLDRFLLRVRLPGDLALWCDPLEDESPLPAGEAWVIGLPDLMDDGGLIQFPGRP